MCEHCLYIVLQNKKTVLKREVLQCYLTLNSVVLWLPRCICYRDAGMKNTLITHADFSKEEEINKTKLIGYE